MSQNVAAVIESVAETVPPVPFINWQYVYCWLISLFGAECTATGVPAGGESISSGIDAAVNGASLATTSAGNGFWSWLWPFQSGGADAGALGVQGGFTAVLSTVYGVIPQPILSAIAAVGWFLGAVWSAFSFVSYTISGVFALMLAGAVILLISIRLKEWRDFRTIVPHSRTARPSGDRWSLLLQRVMSKDPKEWREAIRAADAQLGAVLTQMGYAASSVDVQLQNVPEGAFVTLPQAWEAHRVHNFVVRRGSQFILTQREAFRVMKLYEQVFEEFGLV